MGSVIDVYASQPNYWRHLAPVVDELRARGHEMRTWASIPNRPWGARLMRTPATDLMVVASWVDARRWAHLRCAYLEHGAGQTYLGDRPTGYAGAPQLDHVVLFLGPNDRIAERWLAQYPGAMVATVGCPALDQHLSASAESASRVEDVEQSAHDAEPDQDAEPGEGDRGSEHEGIVDAARDSGAHRTMSVTEGRYNLGRGATTDDGRTDDGLRPRGVPVVAVTHHWWCGVCPETVPALPAYETALAALSSDPGVRVMGHAHPRAHRRTERFWRRLDIGYETDPDAILRTAGLLVADNTSLMYEAAALDIPVLAVNAPSYRRDVEHGLRFWSHVPGLQVDEPADLVPRIYEALADPPEARALRARAAAHVYAHRDGSSTARAADAIEKVL
jgi:glycosyltransferase involved in cell wall biosynthesis